jgi:TnpA family transposase
VAGLSLIAAAIVHRNTIHLDRAVRQLRAQGTTVPDDPQPSGATA